MTLLGIIGTITTIIIGYLIGSFNWAIFIGKVFYKVDVRTYYSKNAGATNASRIFGVWVGLLIVILDGLKVFITAGVAIVISLINNHDNISFATTSYFIPLIFTCLGHSYPLYHNFKGGKVVSCFFALLILSNPYIFLIATGVWFILFFLFRYISLASICAAIISIACCWIPYLNNISYFSTDWAILVNNHLLWLNYCHILVNPKENFLDNILTINIVICATALLLIIRHYENIKRLFLRTEPKYHFKKTKKFY